MSKQYDKYTYDDKQYSFIQRISSQEEDGSITEQVKLIDSENDCVSFFFKKFFDEKFVKIEPANSQKRRKIIDKVLPLILNSAVYLLTFSLLLFWL